MPNFLPRSKALKQHSQDLRKEATKEERRLWYEYLKTYPVQFRRQKVIGRYIIDFYCHEAKLAVELDGSQHYEPEGETRDAERTAYLNALGIRVLRFSNSDINSNLAGVCAQIDQTIKTILTNKR